MAIATIQLTCAECATPFSRRTAEVNKARQRGQDRDYCSRACVTSAKRNRAVEGDCRQCGTHFTRTSNGKRERGTFCSRRCGALHRNATRPKKPCPECGGPRHDSARRCKDCRTAGDRRIYESTTLAQLRERYSTSQYHAKIRGLARSIYRGPMACARCGYDLYVEVCHIRDLASFPMSATVAQVNDPSNLAALDRRCHWELDHGYLVCVIDGNGTVSWVRTVP